MKNYIALSICLLTYSIITPSYGSNRRPNYWQNDNQARSVDLAAALRNNGQQVSLAECFATALRTHSERIVVVRSPEDFADGLRSPSPTSPDVSSPRLPSYDQAVQGLPNVQSIILAVPKPRSVQNSSSAQE